MYFYADLTYHFSEMLPNIFQLSNMFEHATFFFIVKKLHAMMIHVRFLHFLKIELFEFKEW